MHRVVTVRIHHEAILGIDEALLIPDALVRTRLPTPPGKTRERMSLPWREAEVEEMVQGLIRCHLGGALRGQGSACRCPRCAGHWLVCS